MGRDRTHVAEPLARPSCSRCPPQLEGSQAAAHVRLAQGRAPARGLQTVGTQAFRFLHSRVPANLWHEASLFKAVFPVCSMGSL